MRADPGEHQVQRIAEKRVGKDRLVSLRVRIAEKRVLDLRSDRQGLCLGHVWSRGTGVGLIQNQRTTIEDDAMPKLCR